MLYSVKEINYGGITVEATSPEQAREIAEQEHFNGNVYWKNTDVDYPDIQKEKIYER